MMEKMKNKYFLTISTSILGLCLFLASGCSFISVSLVPPVAPLRETTVMGKGKEKVLIVEISGIISEEEKRGIAGLSGEPDMVARIKEELKTAAKDKRVKAIILRINSPGGTVTASDMIYHEIEQFKRKQTTKLLPASWIWGHRAVTT